MINLVWIIIRAALCTLCFATAAMAHPSYKITEIGTLGGDSSKAFCINERGDVTGTSATKRGCDHAFLYRDYKLVDLTPAMKLDTVGQFINSRDQVALYAATRNNDYAYIWSKGRLKRLLVPYLPYYVGELGARAAVDRLCDWQMAGLSDHGTIAGMVDINSDEYGYLWRGGRCRLFSDSSHLFPTAMNSRGDYAYTQDSGTGWLSGNRSKLLKLPYLSGMLTITCLNQKGQMAGVVFTGAWAIESAYYVQDGHATRIAAPGLTLIRPSAIDNRGEVVGECRTYRGTFRAFLYQSGKVKDLNSLIDPKSGWVLNDARGINEKGQIVGTGTCRGQVRGFILTPITLR